MGDSILTESDSVDISAFVTRNITTETSIGIKATEVEDINVDVIEKVVESPVSVDDTTVPEESSEMDKTIIIKNVIKKVIGSDGVEHITEETVEGTPAVFESDVTPKS